MSDISQGPVHFLCDHFLSRPLLGGLLLLFLHLSRGAGAWERWAASLPGEGPEFRHSYPANHCPTAAADLW